ncbi:MAG: hypothetical protein APF76_00505 [Desulfitibacter sp. BRH_c19]|nr:MAG: hypothetical protein APF76_00505 [Desulfitibacter sp. BRH_c19]
MDHKNKNIDKGKPVHGGNVWAASQRWGIAPENFLDFSANINLLGPSPKAIEVIQDSLGVLSHYPEPTGESFKICLSKFFNINSENIVLGNGGAELIYLVGRIFYKKRILLLAPTFSEYGEGIENPNIIYIGLDSKDSFMLPTNEIIHNMEKNDLIFIGNPNNPTGGIFPKEEIKKILETAVEKSAVVIIDEAFIDFLGDESYSVRYWVNDYPNLIVVGSLTKFFAIPSLRLGYAIAARDTALRMEYLLPTWRINTFALKAGEASINDKEYIQKTLNFVKEEREFLTKGLTSIKGLKVYPGAANYILVDGESLGLTSGELQERLGPYGILIRKCASYYNLSPYYFRLGVKKREENIKLLETLKKVADI